MNKRVLMAATVPSMIGQFNMGNIDILQQMGYIVDVACDFTDDSVWPKDKTDIFKKQLCLKGIECIQIGFSRSPIDIISHIKSYRTTLDLLKRRNYAFIHTHTPIASAIIRVAARKTNTKVIYTAHGFHFYKNAPIKNWILFYPIEKILSKWTNTIITINLEDYDIARIDFFAKDVFYVPGVGIDIEKFNSVKTNRTELRKSIGVSNNDFMILSVGELSKRKNHEIVIKTLGMVDVKKWNLSKIHYFICGKGNLKDYLNNESLKYNVNLHLLGYRNDIANLCNCCDLFIFPSLQEGLPVALMEAIACKTPVICSNIRGNVDIVKNKKLLFMPIDVNDLNQKLTDFVDIYTGNDGTNAIQEITQSNFENLKKFDKKIVTKKMKEIYRQVVIG